MNLTTQFTGHSGVSLLQARLSLMGVNTATPVVDDGTDLLARLRDGKWVTIQVKTASRLEFAGRGKSRSRPMVVWNFAESMSVDYLACVNLETDEIYLYPTKTAESLAQQRSKVGYKLFFDTSERRGRSSKIHPETHAPYLFDTFAPTVFGLDAAE